MKKSDYLLLFVLGLGIAALVAVFQAGPGYMDAEYYFSGSVQLADGLGFKEFFLWNYLDDPAGLPHPSHAYWMPLASLAGAAGMLLSGSHTFQSGRLVFILLAGCVVLLTAKLAFALSGRRQVGIFAGLLAVIPAFYLPYLPTTDTFGIYMAGGALFFLAVISTSRQDRVSLPWLILGVLAGLMHLARADGLLWLAMACVAGLASPWGAPAGRPWRVVIRLTLVIGGYTLIMGPWLVRNQAVFGSLLAPGGGRALWFTAYDDLFFYPASELTFARWWDSGLAAIFRARWWAFGQNIQTALAVQGEIFLVPAILAGMWIYRKEAAVRLAGLGWLLTLAVMSVVFPFAGARGGFFHSGAAFQPLFWALAPVGLERLVQWVGARRGWQVAQAQRVFCAGAVGLAIFLAALVVPGRVIGPDFKHPVWAEQEQQYARLDLALRNIGAQPGERVMVNDPAGYYLASAREAVVIPAGGLQAVMQAARRYSARYLLLEQEQVGGLYNEPGDRPGLKYRGTVEDMQLYSFED